MRVFEFHNFAVPIMNRNTPFICAKNKHIIKVAKNLILAIFRFTFTAYFLPAPAFFLHPTYFRNAQFFNFLRTLRANVAEKTYCQ